MVLGGFVRKPQIHAAEIIELDKEFIVIALPVEPSALIQIPAPPLMKRKHVKRMVEMTGSSEREVVIPIHRPASRERFFFLISGIISSIPLTLFVEQFTDSLTVSLTPLYALLFSSVLFAPFLEEFAKAFPLFYRHGETQRSIFTLGLFVGFGFGVAEFVLYVFLLGVPFIFRIPGVLFHTASTSITAYGIATKRTFMFYLVAVGLHFSNNLIAFAQLASDSDVLFIFLYLGIFFVMFIALLSSWMLYRKTTEKMIPYR